MKKLKLKWRKEWNWPVIAVAGIAGTIFFKSAYDRKVGELKNEKMKNAGLLAANERMVYHLGKSQAQKSQSKPG